MRYFDCSRFAEVISGLTRWEWIAETRIREGLGDESLAIEIWEGTVKPTFDGCKEQCQKVQFRETLKRINGPLYLLLCGAYGAPTWSQLKTEVKVLRETLESELADRMFVFLPVAKSDLLIDLLNDEDHHWGPIWKSFPSARKEMEEAVFCHSLERSTAAVFHLMRVSEIGLRALARRMGVKMPKGKRLEWSEWQQILKEMTDVSEQVAKTKKAGPHKDELLEFYRGALGQFYGFKDEYRNHVMHSRRSYNDYTAAGVLAHVKSFMEKLSARVDEKGRMIK